MNENNYIVYRHTSPNGKMYIGITSRTLEARSGHNGYGYRKNEHFYRAIQKYGWENFLHEIIFSNLSKSEAEAKEIELIALYDTRDAQKGYNNSSGGESGSKGAKFSDETRKKMSIAHKGKRLTEKQMKAHQKINHHRKLSKEAKKKISQAKLGKRHPLSEETKRKIGDAQRGEKNHRYGYVYSDTEKSFLSACHKRKKVYAKSSADGSLTMFEGVRAAERATGCKHSNIILGIKNGRAYKGYYWSYDHNAIGKPEWFNGEE